MNMIQKKSAIEKIELLRKRIDQLRNRPGLSPEFTQWKRDVEVALTHIFVNDTKHVKDFSDIEYSLSFFSSLTPDSDFHIAYLKGLSHADAVLKSMEEEIREYWDEQPVENVKIPDTSIPISPSIDKKTIFVIHGRDELLRERMFDFLRSVGLRPIEWNQAIALTGKSSPYIGEIIDVGLSNAQAALVLFSGDDLAKLKDDFIKTSDPEYEKELSPQARPNVLFEAGMAMGKYPERTILVQVGNLRKWTDVAGRHMTYLDDTPEKKRELVSKLETAGCLVDYSGTDWLKEGYFNLEITPPIIKVQTSPNKRTGQKELTYKQLNELRDKLGASLRDKDPILEREYRIEYVKLLGNAIAAWLDDENVLNQLLLLKAEAGTFNVSMMKSDKMASVKYVLNSVNKLMTILGYQQSGNV